jgi:hypothetical protein
MDPYIERPEICPDFHDRLVTYLCAALNPLLQPRYVALTQDRLYVVEAERPIRPDVAVIRTAAVVPDTEGAVATLDVDAPAIFELWREEVREPFIQIIEPAAGNRVVTAIEVLSPDNTRPGQGRDAYIEKREEFWNSGTNLVEIDLLREGSPTVRISAEKIARLQPWNYLVAVTRHWPSRQEVYPIPLSSRLPRIGIPLAHKDADVILDLQTVFTRCWNEGPYPALLRYEGMPPGQLATKELQWCKSLLVKAGIHSDTSDSG